MNITVNVVLNKAQEELLKKIKKEIKDPSKGYESEDFISEAANLEKLCVEEVLNSLGGYQFFITKLGEAYLNKLESISKA